MHPIAANPWKMKSAETVSRGFERLSRKKLTNDAAARF